MAILFVGSAAEDAGIKAGDKIVSVNKEDMTRLTHSELVSVIKKVCMCTCYRKCRHN